MKRQVHQVIGQCIVVAGRQSDINRRGPEGQNRLIIGYGQLILYAPRVTGGRPCVVRPVKTAHQEGVQPVAQAAIGLGTATGGVGCSIQGALEAGYTRTATEGEAGFSIEGGVGWLLGDGRGQLGHLHRPLHTGRGEVHKALIINGPHLNPMETVTEIGVGFGAATGDEHPVIQAAVKG